MSDRPHVCPDPALCERLRRHVAGRDWEWWTGQCPPERPCDPGMRQQLIELWESTAATRPTLEEQRRQAEVAASDPKRRNPTPQKSARLQQPPCRHRGDPTGETIECPTCAGKVQVKLLVCSLHEQCTVGKKIDGIACCQGCPDYEVGSESGDSSGG